MERAKELLAIQAIMGHGINEEMELVEPERRQEAASMKEMEHVTSTTTEKERE